MLRIANWNLCLGLTQKKDYAYQTLNHENNDMSLLQEVEITNDHPLQLLSNNNSKLEVEWIPKKPVENRNQKQYPIYKKK